MKTTTFTKDGRFPPPNLNKRPFWYKTKSFWWGVFVKGAQWGSLLDTPPWPYDWKVWQSKLLRVSPKESRLDARDSISFLFLFLLFWRVFESEERPTIPFIQDSDSFLPRTPEGSRPVPRQEVNTTDLHPSLHLDSLWHTLSGFESSNTYHCSPPKFNKRHQNPRHFTMVLNVLFESGPISTFPFPLFRRVRGGFGLTPMTSPCTRVPSERGPLRRGLRVVLHPVVTPVQCPSDLLLPVLVRNRVNSLSGSLLRILMRPLTLRCQFCHTSNVIPMNLYTRIKPSIGWLWSCKSNVISIVKLLVIKSNSQVNR